MTHDRDLVIDALKSAQIIFAEHIAPGGPQADLTISRLLAILDNDDLETRWSD